MRKLLFACLCTILIFGGIARGESLENWSLSGGEGSKTNDYLELIGTGSGSNRFLSENREFEPGGLYRFSVEICSPDGVGGSGCLPCGTEFVHRDFTCNSIEWELKTFIFRGPDNRTSGRLSLGQWETSKKFRFRNVKLERIVPIYGGDESVLLGEGESLENGNYIFRGTYGSEGSNGSHRTLIKSDSSFNSNRWTMSDNASVVYLFRFHAPERPGKLIPLDFKEFSVSLNVNHHTRGACILEYSFENDNWTEIARLDRRGSFDSSSIEIPSENTGIYVRFRAEANSGFQVDRFDFEMKCAARSVAAKKVFGKTSYFAYTTERGHAPDAIPLAFIEKSPGKNILICSCRVDELAQNHHHELKADGKTLFVKKKVFNKSGYWYFWIPFYSDETEYKPKIDFELVFPHTIFSHTMNVNPFFREDYGYRISENENRIWWCESGWKVPKSQRNIEKLPLKPILLDAAKNDYESFQLILDPLKYRDEISELTIHADDLVSENGTKIDSNNVQIRSVYYHKVISPTDSSSVPGLWPDALIPLEEPFSPDLNSPLWITVYVPDTAEAGVYSGTIRIEDVAGGENVLKIPFALRVRNFSIPKENNTATAFGMGTENIFRYHNCGTEEEKRVVFDKYLEMLSRYRISPYNPVPMDPIRVTWNPESDPPSAEVDFSRFDKEMERVFDKYEFTHFRLQIEGMGGGTFHERYPGKIGDFEEGTAEYEAMFADYLKKLESHLAEKGWLEKVYVYWFDEPDPKDYELVANGFTKLHEYAPRLRTMITEEPNPEFIAAIEKCGAKIDIWCPVSYNFSEREAKDRQKKGEDIWWYLCCVPKAPYATLFTDHPGTELRVWYWQAWQRGIVGSLIWESVWWTSGAAYPDETQDPYDDPMSYVSGYSVPRGTKSHWGNGDGRFLYPPLEARIPAKEPVLKGPNASIRLEMIREGLEDYEMLLVLRNLYEKQAKKLDPDARKEIEELLTVPDTISKSMTEFTNDPRVIMDRKSKISDAIESLQEIE